MTVPRDPVLDGQELESQLQRMERDAALWWRLYYEGERPYFFPPPTKSLRQETEKHWVSQMWLGQTAFERGLFDEAEVHFRAALAEAEKLGSKSQLGTTLRCLGRSLCAQDKHELAEPMYKRAVEVHGNAKCPTSMDLEEDFDAFVAHYRMQGKYRQAEELIRKVLDSLEKADKNSAAVARYLNNLAVLLCEEGRCKEAEKVYERVLELSSAFTGGAIITHVLALLNLAVLCERNDRRSEAHEHYERAAKILKLLPDGARYRKLLAEYSQLLDGHRAPSHPKDAGPYLHASIPKSNS